MTPPGDPAPLPARRRLGVGAAIAIVLVALAATVAVGVVRSAAAPMESVPTSPVGAEPATADALYVHVSGAVRLPGLYVLAPDARVVDGVAAAGGFAEDAAHDAVNLARPLSDGEQLVIRAKGESTPAAAESDDGRIDLNTADAAQLDSLPRIGPAMAERILRWRDDNGPFTSVEDLLAIPGIGDKMLDALRDLVKV